jgi:hypothetical protein
VYFYFKFKEAENAPLWVTSHSHLERMQAWCSALISQVRAAAKAKTQEIGGKSNTTTAAAVIKQRFFTKQNYFKPSPSCSFASAGAEN